MTYKIFINETPFTADEETIDLVESALVKAGWTLHPTTQGYYPPNSDMAKDAA